MQKLWISISIILFYCVPFAYVGVQQDFTNGSLFGYLVMVATTSALAFASKYFSNYIPFIIGNILSMAVSYYFFTGMESNGRWESFFKPFTPNQFLIFVVVLNLVPQFIAMRYASKYKNGGK
ncbi:hypothetical protein ACWE42_02725 [Sutcliffiella cohnii]